jgi:hypothetical protein
MAAPSPAGMRPNPTDVSSRSDRYVDRLRVPGYSTGSQEWSGSKRVIVNGALPGTGAISF